MRQSSRMISDNRKARVDDLVLVPVWRVGETASGQRRRKAWQFARATSCYRDGSVKAHQAPDDTGMRDFDGVVEGTLSVWHPGISVRHILEEFRGMAFRDVKAAESALLRLLDAPRESVAGMASLRAMAALEIATRAARDLQDRDVVKVSGKLHRVEGHPVQKGSSIVVRIRTLGFARRANPVTLQRQNPVQVVVRGSNRPVLQTA